MLAYALKFIIQMSSVTRITWGLRGLTVEHSPRSRTPAGSPRTRTQSIRPRQDTHLEVDEEKQKLEQLKEKNAPKIDIWRQEKRLKAAEQKALIKEIDNDSKQYKKEVADKTD